MTRTPYRASSLGRFLLQQPQAAGSQDQLHPPGWPGLGDGQSMPLAPPLMRARVALSSFILCSPPMVQALWRAPSAGEQGREGVIRTLFVFGVPVPNFGSKRRDQL